MDQFVRVDAVSEAPVVVILPPNDTEAFGRLRFDPEAGISLELQYKDSIRETIDAIIMSERNKSNIPTLLGSVTNGPPFTLFDSIVYGRKSKLSQPNALAEIKIKSSQLLMGMHVPEPACKIFDEVRITTTELNNWFGRSSLRQDWGGTGGEKVGDSVSVICHIMPRIEFPPSDDEKPRGPSLSIHSNPRVTTDGYHSATISNQYVISVRHPKPFGIEECGHELFRLQSFMSILCGHQVFCQTVSLYLSDLEEKKRARSKVNYLPRLVKPSDEEGELRPDQIFLPLPAIRDDLPSLWHAWVERYHSYRTAVELYSSTEMSSNQILRFQFLSVMQALETLHRNRFGGTYLEEDAYDCFTKAMKEAIPPDTQRDLREAIKARIQYGNEYSLRKRLLELGNKLPGGINGSVGKNIHPELSSFLGRSVDTRNHLTHNTAELESRAFRDADLYWSTRVLRWFFLVVLLSDMGLPEDKLVAALHPDRQIEINTARNSLTKRSHGSQDRC